MRSYFRKDLTPRYSSFSYPINAFSGVDAYSNEDTLPLSWCRYGYNVKIENGRIKENFGINSAKINTLYIPNSLALGSKIKVASIYRCYDYEKNIVNNILIMQLYNGKIYYFVFAEHKYYYSGLQISDKVRFLNYHANDKDLCLLLTDGAKSYTFDGSKFTEITAPPSVGGCVHNTRVFSVNDKTNKLSFSKELDPTNWNVSATEGGYINFIDEGGALTGAISFKNSVYVFKKYAIYRLNAYVDQTDYALSKVFSTNNEIYFDTVAICNETMIFLAEDGFYSFDGYNLKRILGGLTPLIADKSVSHAVYYGNKYYIATALEKHGETVGDEERETMVRNGIIHYDIISGEAGIYRGSNVSGFVPFVADGTNMMLLIFGGDLRGMAIGMFTDDGKVFGHPLQKKWVSPYTDLGNLDKIKVLKKVFIRSGQDVKLTLKLDKEYDITLPGANFVRYVPVNKRAERVGFSVSTNGEKLDVSGLLMEFDFVRRIPNE